MFKEMNYDEMMKVDGGYIGWSERPENITNDNNKDDLKDMAYAAASGATLGAPVLAPVFGYALIKVNRWIDRNVN